MIEIFIWTIILATIFCGLVFGYSKLFIEPNVYNIQFKDIDGITQGSPVRYMGINIGYVRKLKTDDKYINVKIIVTKKNIKISNGTVARVEFYGLGGSKSIELMPPDGSCNVGILTDDTIRIVDVVSSAESFVEILEELEKYVDSIDRARLNKILETINTFQKDKILNTQKEMNKINHNVSKKIDAAYKKENKINEKLESINNVILNINKYIKK